MYTIAVDAMGGDHAPDAIVAGALRALAQFPDISIQLYGDQARVAANCGAHGFGARCTIVHAPDVIGMHEAPVLAVRKKVESSLVMAMLAVKEGRAQALVSAGSTGAILAGGMLRIGRIAHIERPAIVTVLPGRKKPFVLLDCGANVDCQSAYLNQFGLMGSIYAQCLLGVETPEVRLLNIGVEAEKGNKLAKEAYALMQAQSVYRFGGNIEARDVPDGACDVVVCDGFDGNIVIKYSEGLAGALLGMLKERMLANTRAKLGAMLLKPALKAFKRSFNADEYGGAPLLGVRGAVIKAHGNAQADTIMNAIRQARGMLEGDVVDRIGEGLARLTEPENT